jgi:NAD(P)H-dependent flavin oxidoreductase YrpB (nitropropane dioxygenase family)
MLATRFTELVGCSVPIRQAGMGAAAPPELAAAVSNAGALGMLGTARAGGTERALLAGLLEKTRTLTSRPFGVNFIVRENLYPIDPACFDLAADAARVVELFLYAAPDPTLIDRIHRRDALLAAQVGSRDEAAAAANAGCDIIIAQGIGAGGHVRGTIGLLALLDEVLEAVTVPVLAAGGIGSGRAVAAALVAGADGVRVGTRFVTAEETNAHPTYVASLLAARAADTVYTEAYSTNWPNAPHRVLRSSVAAATACLGDVVGETPSLDGTREPVHRFDCLAIDRGTTGAIEAMPHWAGESVRAVKRVQPAAEIVRELAEEAEGLLRRW